MRHLTNKYLSYKQKHIQPLPIARTKANHQPKTCTPICKERREKTKRARESNRICSVILHSTTKEQRNTKKREEKIKAKKKHTVWFVATASVFVNFWQQQQCSSWLCVNVCVLCFHVSLEAHSTHSVVHYTVK